MPEVLQANIDRKSAFFNAVGQFRPNFHIEVDMPHQPLLHRQASECYTSLLADSIHTKKLCSRLSSSEVHFLIEGGHSVFEPTPRPPWGV